GVHRHELVPGRVAQPRVGATLGRHPDGQRTLFWQGFGAHRGESVVDHQFLLVVLVVLAPTFLEAEVKGRAVGEAGAKALLIEVVAGGDQPVQQKAVAVEAGRERVGLLHRERVGGGARQGRGATGEVVGSGGEGDEQQAGGQPGGEGRQAFSLGKGRGDCTGSPPRGQTPPAEAVL